MHNVEEEGLTEYSNIFEDMLCDRVLDFFVDIILLYDFCDLNLYIYATTHEQNA